MSAILNSTAQFLLSRTSLRPETGIILGTGLSGLTDQVKVEEAVPYSIIPGFPVTTVEGHIGKLLFGHLDSVPVLVMQGRFHYYEGYSMSEITFPIRVFKALGIHSLLLSNASGGLNPEFNTGDIMLIRDHINMMPNPLIGPHDAAMGERFPDMSEPYDLEYLEIAEAIAAKKGIALRKGVYVGVTGPTLETPAEYAWYRTIGGDAVGMSTVPEVITARQMGLRCFALSVITDMGVEGRIQKTTHKDVLAVASRVEPMVTSLVKEMISSVNP
jgi:purine-nucleoside phosphorylase